MARTPSLPSAAARERLCYAEMYVGDDVSPDFYGWVFPKYDHVAVGTGTVVNKTAIKQYQQATRDRSEYKTRGGKIIRVEAHPIPEHPRAKRVEVGPHCLSTSEPYCMFCILPCCMFCILLVDLCYMLEHPGCSATVCACTSANAGTKSGELLKAAESVKTPESACRGEWVWWEMPLGM